MGARRQAKKDLAKEQEVARLRAKERQKAARKQTSLDQRQRRVDEAAAVRAGMTPEQRARSDRNFLVAAAVAVLVVGGCIAIGATSGGGDGDVGDDAREVQPADAAPPTTQDDRTQELLAFEACKEFVSRDLKSPGSATFRNPREDDGEVLIESEGDVYTIVSTVDAENSFGAEVRARFMCEVRDADDSWQLVNLDLDD